MPHLGWTLIRVAGNEEYLSLFFTSLRLEKSSQPQNKYWVHLHLSPVCYLLGAFCPYFSTCNKIWQVFTLQSMIPCNQELPFYCA
ncbi:hypothetical protein XENTR_v10005536 [Xenopus tropicalis]|nr:hypothetical protein XENTR_v10005536 [Xenopus tropicalis]